MMHAPPHMGRVSFSLLLLMDQVGGAGRGNDEGVENPSGLEVWLRYPQCCRRNEREVL